MSFAFYQILLPHIPPHSSASLHTPPSTSTYFRIPPHSSAFLRARCPGIDATWRVSTPSARPVSQHRHHLARFHPFSAPGVPALTPPGVFPPVQRARCPSIDTTWLDSTPSARPVSQHRHHLARFHPFSAPGVPASTPPGAFPPVQRVRCPSIDTTWFGSTRSACPVSRNQRHRAQACLG